MQAAGTVFTSGTTERSTSEGTRSLHDFVSEYWTRKPSQRFVHIFGWLVSAVCECSIVRQASLAGNL